MGRSRAIASPEGWGGPTVPAALWGRDSPPGAGIFAAPIQCRDRCRRTAATSRPKSSHRATDRLSQGLARRSVCVSGSCCQHRCCCRPRLSSFDEVSHNAPLLRKVARRSNKSASATFRFITAEPLRGSLHQKKVKKQKETRTRAGGDGRLMAVRSRHQTPALHYMIAVALVLTGPSSAGTADLDTTGSGTFLYRGAPIRTPAPEMMAAVGQ
jgi:hypothetical protein